MNRFVQLLFCTLVAAGLAWAGPTNPSPSQASGRYLMVVETSAAMRSRMAAVQRIFQDLLSSGLRGELKPGETLGLWTFNEALYTGRFPLQVWTPENGSVIARRVSEFLSRQSCEKGTRFETVAPALSRLVKESDRLTIILLSSGEDTLQATPFDAAINSIFTQGRREMQRAREPFVTVLRAQHGEFVGYTVSWAPWPVEFPKFRSSPSPTAAPAKPKGTTARPAPKPPVTSPATTRPSSSPPLPLQSPVREEEPDTAIRPTPTQVPASQPAPEPSPQKSPPQPQIASQPASPMTAAQPAETAQPSEPSSPAPAQPAAGAVATPSPGPSLAQRPPSESATPTAKPPVPVTLLAPEMVVTPESPVPPESAPASVGPVTPGPIVVPPAQAAAAVPAQPASQTSLLRVTAAGLGLGGAAVLIVMMLRRRHAGPRGSLITRSFEREQE